MARSNWALAFCGWLKGPCKSYDPKVRKNAEAVQEDWSRVPTGNTYLVFFGPLVIRLLLLLLGQHVACYSYHLPALAASHNDHE